MKNNPSYAQGGKLTEKEARLLRALMGKLIGEEGMRVMQTSGKTPSLLQKFVDEASQIASAVAEGARGRDEYVADDLARGYRQQEAEDRARDASGQSGRVDAAIEAISDTVGDLFDDEASQQRIYSGRTYNPLQNLKDVYNRARMTDAEREAARKMR